MIVVYVMPLSGNFTGTGDGFSLLQFGLREIRACFLQSWRPEIKLTLTKEVPMVIVMVWFHNFALTIYFLEAQFLFVCDSSYFVF
jgi:hypothetical protein